MASPFAFGALDVDPATGDVPFDPWAPTAKDRVARGLVQGLGQMVATPGRAMKEGITTGEAADWAAPMALGMVGLGRLPGAAPAGSVGSGGSKLVQPETTLPMDQASRLDRAREMGFNPDQTWYHGTTHDFDRFKASGTNTESHMGQGNYFTSSPVDASHNYAGRGPDLTNRIEQIAERYLPEDMPRYGTPEYEAAYAAARERAAGEIAGPHEGAVIPAYLRMKKPLDITSEGSWLDFNPKYDRAGEHVGESPLAMKLYNGMKEMGERYGFDGEKAFGEVAERAELYGDVRAHDLDKALREAESISYAEHPETGQLVSHQVIADLYKKMGFDGVIMDAHAAFPNMKNIPEGTRHAIVFKDNQIRSPQAVFDPAKKASSSILASGAGAAVFGSLAPGEDR